VVLLDPQAEVEENPDTVLRMRIALLGRQAVPAHGLDIVHRRATAVLVEGAEVGLGHSGPLVSGTAVPTHGFGVVPLYPPAVVVTEPKPVLSLRVPLLRRHAIPANRLGIVAGDAPS